MAPFLENLWSSIFTPGPTPTLLAATNITFTLLQLLFLALLVATRSIHFAILSVLCAGLWWSINWFAAELLVAQAQAKEAEQKEEGKKRRGRKGVSGGGGEEWRRRGLVDDSADDEGEDTEVEEGRVGDEGGNLRDQGVAGAVSKGSIGQSSGAQAAGGAEARRRVVEDVDRSGEVSTDSEWEKVSQQSDS